MLQTKPHVDHDLHYRHESTEILLNESMIERETDIVAIVNLILGTALHIIFVVLAWPCMLESDLRSLIQRSRWE